MKALPILAVLALAICAPALAQQFYKWKDADGAWHYTTTPPPAGAQVETVAVDPAGPDAAAAIDGAASQAAAPGATAVATAGSLDEKRAKVCTDSQQRAALLADSPVVTMDIDGDGKPEYLTPEQHAAELQRTRDVARVACSPPQ